MYQNEKKVNVINQGKFWKDYRIAHERQAFL